MLAPNAVASQARFIVNHPGYDLYSWGAELLFPDGTRRPFDASERYRTTTSFTLDELIDHNRILSSTSIDSGLFEELGGLRSTHLEDYDLWLRAMARGARHIHNPEILTVYRMREDSKTWAAVERDSSAAQILTDLAQIPGLDPRSRDAAVRRASYYRAAVERTELERRLRRADYAGARARYWRARRAYLSPLKRAAGCIMIAVSPRLFARMLPPEREKSVAV